MANTIISPNRYVQGRGELKNLPEHAKKLGKKLFVIISASGLKRVRDLLEKSFENTGMELVFEEFQGGHSSGLKVGGQGVSHAGNQKPRWCGGDNIRIHQHKVGVRI